MEQLLLWKSVAVAAWLLIFLVIERARPASPWRDDNPAEGFSQARHAIQNLSLWGINLLVSPLLVVTLTALAVEHGLGWREGWLAGERGWLMVVVDLVVLDLWIYAWHRANHRLPFLWRFHQVHHLDQQLDATSALRFHFGEVVLSALARMPVILLLGMPLVSVVIFETLVALASIFHHANVRIALPWQRALSKVIITPDIHWVHHHALRADTDSNYGTVLSLWDRLFRSRSATARTPAMKLGVENRVENRIARLLVLPFVRDDAD